MSDRLTIRSILGVTTDYFRQRGIDTPRLDAEVLLSHVLKMSRIQLYVNIDAPLQPNEVDAYRAVVRERARRTPVAYITGSKEFMSLDLSVGPGVLIPRGDTEVLVSKVLNMTDDEKPLTIVDIGTGSGAIAVALAVSRPQAKVYGIDISPDAVRYAVNNCIRHGVQDRVYILEGNLLEPLKGLGIGRTIDVIVSNPPYIPSGEIGALEPEVAVHEPKLALDGGQEGLDFYNNIFESSKDHIVDGGLIAVEAGYGQADSICSLGKKIFLESQVEVVKDYAGIDRVVTIRLAGRS